MRGHGFPPPSRFWIDEPRDGNAFAGEGPTATSCPSTTNYEPGGELRRTAVSPRAQFSAESADASSVNACLSQHLRSGQSRALKKGVQRCRSTYSKRTTLRTEPKETGK